MNFLPHWSNENPVRSDAAHMSLYKGSAVPPHQYTRVQAPFNQELQSPAQPQMREPSSNYSNQGPHLYPGRHQSKQNNVFPADQQSPSFDPVVHDKKKEYFEALQAQQREKARLQQIHESQSMYHKNQHWNIVKQASDPPVPENIQQRKESPRIHSEIQTQSLPQNVQPQKPETPPMSEEMNLCMNELDRIRKQLEQARKNDLAMRVMMLEGKQKHLQEMVKKIRRNQIQKGKLNLKNIVKRNSQQTIKSPPKKQPIVRKKWADSPPSTKVESYIQDESRKIHVQPVMPIVEDEERFGIPEQKASQRNLDDFYKKLPREFRGNLIEDNIEAQSPHEKVTETRRQGTPERGLFGMDPSLIEGVYNQETELQDGRHLHNRINSRANRIPKDAQPIEHPDTNFTPNAHRNNPPVVTLDSSQKEILDSIEDRLIESIEQQPIKAKHPKFGEDRPPKEEVPHIMVNLDDRPIRGMMDTGIYHLDEPLFPQYSANLGHRPIKVDDRKAAVPLREKPGNSHINIERPSQNELKSEKLAKRPRIVKRPPKAERQDKTAERKPLMKPLGKRQLSELRPSNYTPKSNKLEEARRLAKEAKPKDTSNLDSDILNFYSNYLEPPKPESQFAGKFSKLAMNGLRQTQSRGMARDKGVSDVVASALDEFLRGDKQ